MHPVKAVSKPKALLANDCFCTNPRISTITIRALFTNIDG